MDQSILLELINLSIIVIDLSLYKIVNSRTKNICINIEMHCSMIIVIVKFFIHIIVRDFSRTFLVIDFVGLYKTNYEYVNYRQYLIMHVVIIYNTIIYLYVYAYQFSYYGSMIVVIIS